MSRTEYVAAHTPDVESQPPWRSATLYLILASSMMGVMGVTIVSPVLPELRPVFDISDAQVGLVITAYTIPGIFLTPFIGLAADRFGRKPVLVPLLFTFGIAGAAIAFVDEFSLVLVLRFIQGIGASGLVMLAITLIGDLYEGGMRRSIIGLNSSMMSSGAAFYPLVGGALAVVYWSLPFLFFGVGIVVALLALFLLEEPESDEETDAGTYFVRMIRVMLLPRALIVLGAVFAVFFIFFGAIVTALPLLLADQFALRASSIGIVLAAVAVSSAIVSAQYGRLSQYQPPAQLLTLGFVIFGASFIVVWGAPNVIVVGLGLFGFGIGLGVVMPSVELAIVSLVSEDLRAGLMGVRTSLIFLGQTLGPVTFTFTADRYFLETVDGYYALIFVSGLLFAGSGLIAYMFLRERQRG